MINQSLLAGSEPAVGQEPTAIHIPIPSNQLEPSNQILIEGNQVNITVEQVALPG